VILTHEDVCSILVETSVPITDEYGPHLVKLHCAQGLQLVSMIFMRSLLSSGRTEGLLMAEGYHRIIESWSRRIIKVGKDL